MKIVSVDKVEIFPKDVKTLERFAEVVVYHDIPDEKQGIERIKDADIVIDNWFDMPSRVIAACQNLKMISVAAIGYEWIDLKEASERNIIVSNSPAYCAESVAEHTIGLLLNTARQASLSERELRDGKWDPLKYRGVELFGKTLGVLGYGSIGKRVAEIASKGLGMKILYLNTSTSKEGFNKLLKESDVIASELPLNDKTRGFLGEKEFKLMKKGVIIINTGRGAVIDEDALVNNLKSGKILAAGLDVFSTEPLPKNSLLIGFPNVTLTPHIAFNTNESQKNLSKVVTNNIVKFLAGKPINVVN